MTDRQTHTHHDYSAPSLENIDVIDNFDLHVFQFNIDFVILGSFLLL